MEHLLRFRLEGGATALTLCWGGDAARRAKPQEGQAAHVLLGHETRPIKPRPPFPENEIDPETRSPWDIGLIRRLLNSNSGFRHKENAIALVRFLEIFQVAGWLSVAAESEVCFRRVRGAPLSDSDLLGQCHANTCREVAQPVSLRIA